LEGHFSLQTPPPHRIFHSEKKEIKKGLLSPLMQSEIHEKDPESFS
jgi:hypothetical protein